MANIPQRGTDNLDVTIRTSESGSTSLFLGEYFSGEKGWLPGSRSFYLPMTTTADRELSAQFVAYIVEQFNKGCEIPVKDPKAVAATGSHSAFQKYLANTRNGAVKTTPAPAPAADAATAALHARLNGSK